MKFQWEMPLSVLRAYGYQNPSWSRDGYTFVSWQTLQLFPFRLSSNFLLNRHFLLLFILKPFPSQNNSENLIAYPTRS